jgi:hypothetical protein
MICCRNVKISASIAARDRNRSTTAHTMSLTRSLITDQHRAILGQPPANRFATGTADDLRAIRFGYDPTTSRDGTVVAGHPAILTALIDNTGTVAGLKIETDPKARLYLRKKAFLFGPQVKARYGLDGWACTQAQPEAGEQPVGGVYVKERCTKTIQGRALVIERNLFRQAGQDEKSFVDETRVTILRAPSQKGMGLN